MASATLRSVQVMPSGDVRIRLPLFAPDGLYPTATSSVSLAATAVMSPVKVEVPLVRMRFEKFCAGSATFTDSEPEAVLPFMSLTVSLTVYVPPAV